MTLETYNTTVGEFYSKYDSPSHKMKCIIAAYLYYTYFSGSISKMQETCNSYNISVAELKMCEQHVARYAKLREIAPLSNFYFTFGMGHEHANCYHIVKAEDYNIARWIMFERFGTKWSMQYTKEGWVNDNGITMQEEYKLREIDSNGELCGITKC